MNELLTLLNKPYREGREDCYGLARNYYAKVYGMELRNYARPLGFDEEGLDLLKNNFEREGFKTAINGVPELISLERGDGLLFKLASRDKINHVGVYVGSGYFIHHLFAKVSTIDRLDQRWLRRIALVARHPDVTHSNNERILKTTLEELLPPHLQTGVKL